MKLDSRIIEGKKPLSCFDTVEADKFIGEQGYFSDNIEAFSNMSSLTKDVLKAVSLSENDQMPYITKITSWKYFLPEQWVKKSEKKYRPFSIEEWKFKHSVGNTILYRYKGTYCDDHREAEVMYLGYVKPLDGVTDEAGKGELVLGNESLGLQNLFNNYEIWADGEWKPFGVIEND